MSRFDKVMLVTAIACIGMACLLMLGSFMVVKVGSAGAVLMSNVAVPVALAGTALSLMATGRPRPEDRR